MEKTLISALVREKTPDAAIEEAALGVADGAEAVMFDMSETPPEMRTEENFRRMIGSLDVPAQFCLYDLSDATRLPAIDGPMLAAAKAGAAYVDVSAAGVSAAKSFSAKVIVSEHLLDRSASFDEALAIFGRQRSTGADVVKLVARMDTEAEFAEAQRVMAYLRDEFDRPWIYLGLGEYGFRQRFLGLEYGCAMEFAVHRPFPGKKDQPLIRDFVARRGEFRCRVKV